MLLYPACKAEGITFSNRRKGSKTAELANNLNFRKQTNTLLWETQEGLYLKRIGQEGWIAQQKDELSVITCEIVSMEKRD